MIIPNEGCEQLTQTEQIPPPTQVQLHRFASCTYFWWRRTINLPAALFLTSKNFLETLSGQDFSKKKLVTFGIESLKTQHCCLGQEGGENTPILSAHSLCPSKPWVILVPGWQAQHQHGNEPQQSSGQLFMGSETTQGKRGTCSHVGAPQNNTSPTTSHSQQRSSRGVLKLLLFGEQKRFPDCAHAMEGG